MRVQDPAQQRGAAAAEPAEERHQRRAAHAGLEVLAQVADLLLQAERQKFLAEEWPRVHATIQRLGLKPEELLESAAARTSSSDTAEKEPNS